VAQVGIARATILEDFTQVGGPAAMAGHRRRGRGAQAGGIADAPAGALLPGSPAQPRKEFFRPAATVRRMLRN
jgi:UDP-3-O-[3-hydroxymyristoyl] glucosamine N-acyltransferase